MCAITHTLIPARNTNKRFEIKAWKEPGRIDSEGIRTEGLKGGWGETDSNLLTLMPHCVIALAQS